MSLDAFQPRLDFEAAEGAVAQGAALVVDLDGFEGPLHVLLALARQQKVDLLTLSITALADQYLAFVRAARSRSFSLAADYLVMAAWLAYLKSRLLLPKPERPRGEEPPAEELAGALAFQLAKLDAMRKAGEALMALPRTGRDCIVRGDPDAIQVRAETRLDLDLYALVQAYAHQTRRTADKSYSPTARTNAYPLEAARQRLRSLCSELTTWTALEGVAPKVRRQDGPSRASYIASTLSAGLELVKEGALEAQQLDAFAEVFIRARAQGGDGRTIAQ